MRKTLSTWVLAFGLLAATQAQATASFANRNLGLGVSGFTVIGDPTAMGINWGVPITLEGGLYIENGFEVYLKVPLVFANQRFGVEGTATGEGIVLASGGQFGVRYLFLEESIRPYVAVHIAGLYFIRNTASLNNFFGGPGAAVGVDFFVNDSISLGLRGYADLYITLNRPVNLALGGGLYATTYF